MDVIQCILRPPIRPPIRRRWRTDFRRFFLLFGSRHAQGAPPFGHPYSCRFPEQLIGIVKTKILVSAEHQRRSAAFLCSIPVFDGNKYWTADAEECHQKTAFSKIVDLPMLDLILSQRADLAVYEPVHLRHQNDMKPKMPMLTEKRTPLLPFLIIPAPAVKHPLTFVDNEICLSLDQLAAGIGPVIFQRIVPQILYCDLLIMQASKTAAFFRGNHTFINFKVCDNVAAMAKIKENILCHMVGLAGTGSPSIQIDHDSTPLINQFCKAHDRLIQVEDSNAD